MEHSGVILLFFDLPVLTSGQRRQYRKFMKYLKSSGFIRLQESVYVRLQRSVKSTQYNITDIRNNAPDEGYIMVLPLTVNTFSKLTSVIGTTFDVPFLCDDVISI